MPQFEPPFAPVTKRRSATQEELAARQTQDNPYPPASPHRVGHTPGLHGEDAPYLSQQIIRPGYDKDTTQMFTNSYLNEITGFNTFRFMDWAGKQPGK